MTVTRDGSIATVTVTPTTGVSGANQANITSQSTGVGTGAAVGIAIGVVAILALAGFAAFWVWRRKKQRQDQRMFPGGSPRGNSAGMTNSPKSTEAGIAPPMASRNMDGQWETDQLGRRRSMLMPIDPRIDPQHSGIYARDGNKSHESVNTLRDDQDYSRRVHQPPKILRTTNPDPDDD